MTDRLSILMVAPFDGSDATAVRDYLFSFNAHSKHHYRYVFDCRVLDERFDLASFDVIVIFWTLDVVGPALSDVMCERIAAARALKVLFRQDDYRDVRRTNEAMRRLGIQLVFGCVDAADTETFYPRARIPTLEASYTVLPGYVPRYLERVTPPPASSRQIDLGYRSRAMPFYLGDLGREKRLIAERFTAIAEEYGFRADISVREEDRLYGRRWVTFLRSCRCVLGSASGASVVDFTGDIRRNCERYLALNPAAGYDEVKARFFADVDGAVVIDTVSPRVFEAAAFRCTMVNHEGRYGRLLAPDRHYICVKRDYSNVAEVVERIRDREFCRQLADNAHADLIASGRYSYAAFARDFDEALARHIGPAARATRASSVRFYARNYLRHRQAIIPVGDRFVLAPSSHLAFEVARRGLARLPRSRLGPVLSRLIQNPMNFAVKAATTWWVALTTRPLRSLLVVSARLRRAGHHVPVVALLDDLRKLDVIRRAQAGVLRTRQPFSLCLDFDGVSRTLVLTSVVEFVPPPSAELPDEGGQVNLLVWDHSALGHQVVYSLGRRHWLTASVGPGGVHRFDAVSQLLRLQPDEVWPVLRRVLERPPRAGSIRESARLKATST